MFSNEYNKKIQKEIENINRQFIAHQRRTGRGDVQVGSGQYLLGRAVGGAAAGGAATGGAATGGECPHCQGSGILDLVKLPFKMMGLGESRGEELAKMAESYEGGKKKRGRPRKAKGGAEGAGILDIVKLPFKALKVFGLGKKKKGGAETGGANSLNNTGGAETGGKRKRGRPRKAAGGSLFGTLAKAANMFNMSGPTPLENIVGPEATNAFKNMAYDAIGSKLGLGKPKKAKAEKKVKKVVKSPWVAHVKKWAADHKMKYGDAMKDKACAKAYHK